MEENERLKNNTCVSKFCGAYERVQNNTCVACPPGTVNPSLLSLTLCCAALSRLQRINLLAGDLRIMLPVPIEMVLQIGHLLLKVPRQRLARLPALQDRR